MRAEDLRAFANRDWAAIAEHKRDHWVAAVRADGPMVALRAAEALRKHAERFLGAPARAAARRQDLADHIRLKQRIDAAASAFRR